MYTCTRLKLKSTNNCTLNLIFTPAFSCRIAWWFAGVSLVSVRPLAEDALPTALTPAVLLKVSEWLRRAVRLVEDALLTALTPVVLSKVSEWLRPAAWTKVLSLANAPQVLEGLCPRIILDVLSLEILALQKSEVRKELLIRVFLLEVLPQGWHLAVLTHVFVLEVRVSLFLPWPQLVIQRLDSGLAVELRHPGNAHDMSHASVTVLFAAAVSWSVRRSRTSRATPSVGRWESPPRAMAA